VWYSGIVAELLLLMLLLLLLLLLLCIAVLRSRRSCRGSSRKCRGVGARDKPGQQEEEEVEWELAFSPS
jgi:hypothetical protein